ncbi:MAG: hypothetical protein CSA18_04285 [Deltaproteobacteria bacterium]|nr:MAG: hypothetical protein CSA18_04285 [Deltaproteobacteria bacterium]
MHEINDSPSDVSPDGNTKTEQKDVKSEYSSQAVNNFQTPYVNPIYAGGYMSYVPYQIPVQQAVSVQPGQVYQQAQMPVQQEIPVQTGQVYQQMIQPVGGYQYQPVAVPGYNVYGTPVQYYPQAFVQPFANPDMGSPENADSQHKVENSAAADSSHEESHEEHPGQERIPKFDEHKYGQLMEVVNDFVNGKTPEMSTVMDLMNGVDTQFVKGIVVGGACAFAASSETVRNAAVNMAAKIMNAFGAKG